MKKLASIVTLMWAVSSGWAGDPTVTPVTSVTTELQGTTVIEDGPRAGGTKIFRVRNRNATMPVTDVTPSLFDYPGPRMPRTPDSPIKATAPVAEHIYPQTAQSQPVSQLVSEPCDAPASAGYAPGGVCRVGHTSAGCAEGGAASGMCWTKFKTWLTYKQSCTYPPTAGVPTPYYDPVYALFNCQEKGGCGRGGCATGAQHAAATPLHPYSTNPYKTAVVEAAPADMGTNPQYVPTAAAGTVLMPGYRFANAENPAATSRGVIVPTSPSYKIPVLATSNWQSPQR